ncbi:MAG: hypothetical protein GC185_11860 [Alphaproteobacteria bacterium]|nr:hypothetical protein [Alphaproteobacteria bacterium]
MSAPADTGGETYSLRWRLLRMIAVPLMLGSLLVAMFSAWSIYHEIEEIYDTNLAQYARMLLQVVDTDKMGRKTPDVDNDADDDKKSAELSKPAHPYESHIAYRTYLKGEMFTISKSAHVFGDVAPPAGFSDQVIHGKRWRFFVLLGDDGQTRVEVGQKFSIRHELVFQLMGSLWLPGLLFVAVVFLATWSGVSRGLRQIVDLSAAVDRRDAGDLAPISPGRLPEEIMPFLRALNRLLGRLDDGLRREREFTDNAAHELRTPLAAIKTQAQAIAQAQQREGRAVEGMDNLLSGIARSTRLVEQMLAFSRLQGAAAAREPVELAPVIDDVLAELEPATAARGVTAELDAEPDCTVLGNDHALFLMFRNIVENAVKFSPKGGKVTLRLRKTLSAITAEALDEGPGIPPGDAARIFERFYRADKGASEGSGIGLAIVKWVADAHGARVEAVNTNPGFCLRVTFPLPQASCVSLT